MLQMGKVVNALGPAAILWLLRAFLGFCVFVVFVVVDGLEQICDRSTVLLSTH